MVVVLNFDEENLPRRDGTLRLLDEMIENGMRPRTPEQEATGEAVVLGAPLGLLIEANQRARIEQLSKRPSKPWRSRQK